MAGQVRPWPVRAVERGTPQDVALSRRIAAATAGVEAREVLAEGQEGHGWEQPSLFSPWLGEAA
ncbi:MAG: hypothetical protein FWH11_15110 [Micrococcales bacterium]|nr:hypothetical protein [Micrococcales bacterium]